MYEDQTVSNDLYSGVGIDGVQCLTLIRVSLTPSNVHIPKILYVSMQCNVLINPWNKAVHSNVSELIVACG